MRPWPGGWSNGIASAGTIEQLFWTLKRQGLDVEASQVETADGLSKLAFLATLAATRIMQLVHARDGGDAEHREDLAQRCTQRLLEGDLAGGARLPVT